MKTIRKPVSVPRVPWVLIGGVAFVIVIMLIAFRN